MQSITLDYKNFKAGISTADGVEDGGYSPIYGGHNLQEENDALLYPQHAYELDIFGVGVADILDGNTANPVIYVKSPLYGAGALDAVFGVLYDTASNPYGHDSINRFTDEGGLGNGSFGKDGKESGVSFQGDIYVMNDDQIALTTISSLGNYGSTDSDWWTNVRGHSDLRSEKNIAVVVEDTAYFIETNTIHIWDGSTSQEDALTLPPDFYATAAIKHPNGRDLIVLGTVKDAAEEVAGVGFRAYYINTTDLEFTDEIQIDGEVQGLWNVAGTLYVTSGEWLGIFTGTGIEKIKKLGVNLDDSPARDIRENQIWTHHGAVTDQGYLLIPDGNKVLAVGNIGNGTILWHVADFGDDMDVVHMLFNIGNKYVGVFGYTGERWTAANLEATILYLDDHDGAAKWASNKIRFNTKTWIRRIVVDHETLETGDDLKIHHIKENGTLQEIRQITHTKYGAIGETRIDCNIETDGFQPVIEWITGGVGIKKVTIFYESGE